MLGAILYHSSSTPEWDRQLIQLEEWLSVYPRYQTRKFGRRVLNSFFSAYAELEVFHHLCQAGVDPT
ncbi:MAG: hypothetical protein ABFC89_02735, partial [Methanospirillum sp.]